MRSLKTKTKLLASIASIRCAHSMYGIDISLSTGYFQFILWRLIFTRFQCEHFHFLFEWQLLGHTIARFLLLLLLLLLQSACSWISATFQLNSINNQGQFLILQSVSTAEFQFYDNYYLWFPHNIPVNFLCSDHSRCLLYCCIPRFTLRSCWCLEHCGCFLNKSL